MGRNLGRHPQAHGFLMLVFATVAVMMIGGSSTAVRATNNNLLLTNTPEELRERVMASKTFNESISAIAMVLTGALADTTNITLALSVVGGAGLCVTRGLSVA